MTRKIDIKGYNGKYYITDKGEVFRRYKNHDRKLKQSKRGQVNLYLDGKRINASVSSLVKSHVYGITDPNICVYHKNGVSSDFSPRNLLFMTHSEWCKMRKGRPNYKAVAKLCSTTKEVLDIYPSMTDAAKANNVSLRTIFNWCKGKHQDKTLPVYDFKYDADISY